MRDPREGVAPDGTIVTGVSLSRIPPAFAPAIAAAIAGFRLLEPPDDAELLLYGSVATGQARVGESDIDLIAAGVSAEDASALGAALTARFATLCRGVEVGATTLDGHLGPGDEAYGNRVFLRHYCVALHGPDRIRGTVDFPADARAARGFNGDIRRRLDGWRAEAPTPDLGRTVARKALLAAAGLHSVSTGAWTTDRRTGAAGWIERRPDLAADVASLERWSDGSSLASPTEVAAALGRGSPIEQIADEFAAAVGLWGDRTAPR